MLDNAIQYMTVPGYITPSRPNIYLVVYGYECSYVEGPRMPLWLQWHTSVKDHYTTLDLWQRSSTVDADGDYS